MFRVILLGKPNVGKSSLFNILTRKKTAIVASERNVTRDVITGVVKHRDLSYTLLDVGGLTEEKGDFLDIVKDKIRKTLMQVDFALVVFDVNVIDREDQQVMENIRRKGVPHLVLANKCDSNKKKMYLGDVYALGCKEVFSFSCKEMSNINDLRETIYEKLQGLKNTSIEKKSNPRMRKETSSAFKLGLIGKPNVGKSSLMNLLLGRDRSIISSKPGTTRDSISEIFEHDNFTIEIIDTAGIRRKSREKELVEEYAVKKSLGIISFCDVILLMIDATEGLSSQDKKIAGVINTRNKALVIAINKWDLMRESWKDYEKNFRFDFPQVAHVPIIPISCQTTSTKKQNIKKLLEEVHKVWRYQNMEWPTSELNKLLKQIEYEAPPKHYGQGMLKMYHTHQVKTNPPVIKVFINKLKYMERSYAKYLQNAFMHNLFVRSTINGRTKKALRVDAAMPTKIKLKFAEKEKP